MTTTPGSLDWLPAANALDLVAEPVAAALSAHPVPSARIAPVDGALSDTAAFCHAYGVPSELAANCIIVEARRGETTTPAAVLVLGSARADINKVVRKHLGARKISFAAPDRVAEATGMEFGGITPIGLPDDWPILIDTAVAAVEATVIGGGVRTAKILVSGTDLVDLPGAEVLDLAVAT